MHQLCGLIINWSDQPYTDSKLQCHCERKASITDAYIIDHIVYNMYTKEEILIGNISPKVIWCYTYNDGMCNSKTKTDTCFFGRKCFAILYNVQTFLFTCKLYFYISIK